MADIKSINTTLLNQLPNIAISAAIFDNDPLIKSCLNQYFSDSNYTVLVDVERTKYSFDPVKEVISFSGQGTGGPFDQADIEAFVIKISDNLIQISITANHSDGWTLVNSFKDLDSEILKNLPMSKPKLYWANYDSDPDDTVTGFYLTANLNLQSPYFLPLTLLFPGVTNPEIFGQIEMTGTSNAAVIQYVPSMHLTTDSNYGSQQIGPITISAPEISIFSCANYNFYDNVWSADNYLLFKTQLIFKDTSILVESQLTSVKQIVLRGSINSPIGAALAEIEKLVGVSALEVPGFVIKYADEVYLKDITIVLDPGGTQFLQSVFIEIGTNSSEKWHIGGPIYLENIDLQFQIDFSQGKPSISGSLSGTISEWLLMRASFDAENYMFFTELLQPVSISEAYTFFTGNTMEPLDFSIDEAEINLIYPVKKNGFASPGISYSGDLASEGKWVVLNNPDGTSPPLVVIKGLIFHVDHDTEDGETNINAGGIFSIDDYSLFVSGDYESGNGWSIAGNMDLTQEAISLKDIALKIDRQFAIDPTSAPSLPHFITDWAVEGLAVSYQTKAVDFRFSVGIKYLDVPNLSATFGIHLKNSKPISKEFFGSVSYGTAEFSILFSVDITEEEETKKVTFIGTYTKQDNKPPTLSMLLAALSKDLGMDVSLPQELNIDAAANDFALLAEQVNKNPVQLQLAGDFTLTVSSLTLDINFAYSNSTFYDNTFKIPAKNTAGKPAHFLSVGIGNTIKLSNLPFIGKVPGIDKLGIDKPGFYYTNADFSSAPNVYIQIPQTTGTPGALDPEPTIVVLTKSGFTFNAVFGIINGNGSVNPLGSMPIPVITSQAVSGQPVVPSVATSPISWANVNKTFGPVTLQKIGLSYANSMASVYLNAGFAIGGFEMIVQGLSISIPVPPSKADVSFDLMGLELDYSKNGMVIDGAFLKETIPPSYEDTGGILYYLGAATIEYTGFNFTALGGYSPAQHGQPESFFLYANIDHELGGTPAFFITGLAFGFGINTQLKMPTLANLPACPLIYNPPPANTDPKLSLTDTLKSLIYDPSTPGNTGMLIYKDGEYWIAAGLKFTSYEMIQGFALAVVSFGDDLEIDILGSASVTLPTGAEGSDILAYVEIDLIASYKPEDGLMSFMGMINPASFIMDKQVQLAGGFALFVWYSGVHSGDFVFTIGGYHPNFARPAWYPVVPMVAINFTFGPFQATGNAYVALLPHMFMAGLRYSATWSLGNVSAYYDLAADFLVTWAPFTYSADASVNVGCSVSLLLFTLHASVGATATIWGPSFGGKVHVDLDVVSFTISFGSDQITPLPVLWSDLEKNFLPGGSASIMGPVQPLETPSANFVAASIVKGLLKKDMTDPNTSITYDWVIDPEHFEIDTSSVIPFNNVEWKSKFPESVSGDLSIPNDITQFNSNSNPYKPEAGLPYLQVPAGITNRSATISLPANTVWQPELNIKPMEKTGVTSLHTIQLLKAKDGNFNQPQNRISVEPIISNTSNALWGTPGPGNVNDPPLLTDVLTGFKISPFPWSPDVMNNIPLIDLLFEQGNIIDWEGETVNLPANISVSSGIDQSNDLSITIKGNKTLHFTNEHYILSTISDPAVAGNRTAFIGDLMANGFGSLQDGQLTLIGTREALSDWPLVSILGENNFEN